jgi:phosphoserine aminotransferase
MLPMNLLKGGRAGYHNTGQWSKGAIAEAERFGTLDILFDSASSGFDRVPQPGEAQAPASGSVYLHYTSNNTVAGTQYHHTPEVPAGCFLACDMSSDFLSRPVDGSKYGLIYAGAQKNIGPSGATVVVIRKSLMDATDRDIPSMLQYPIHAAKGSMYNTPCTFSIYMIDLITSWIEDNGGLQAIDARNRAQANSIYDVIDSGDAFRGKVERSSRSLMNVTFTTGDADRDTRFWQTAAAQGISGLKGHRSMGGLRASMYNAQTDEAVHALIAFMRAFD